MNPASRSSRCSTPRARRAGSSSRTAARSSIPTIGLRNILVHGYDTVDLDILWKIAEKDLPPLISRLEELLAT